MLSNLVEEKTDDWWMGEIEPPFFGKGFPFSIICPYYVSYGPPYRSNFFDLSRSPDKFITVFTNY